MALQSILHEVTHNASMIVCHIRFGYIILHNVDGTRNSWLRALDPKNYNLNKSIVKSGVKKDFTLLIQYLACHD